MWIRQDDSGAASPVVSTGLEWSGRRSAPHEFVGSPASAELPERLDLAVVGSRLSPSRGFRFSVARNYRDRSHGTCDGDVRFSFGTTDAGPSAGRAGCRSEASSCRLGSCSSAASSSTSAGSGKTVLRGRGHGSSPLIFLTEREASFTQKPLDFPDGKKRAAGRPGGTEQSAFGETVDGDRADADGVRGFFARKREFQVLGGGLNRVIHDGAESSRNRPG